MIVILSFVGGVLVQIIVLYILHLNVIYTVTYSSKGHNISPGIVSAYQNESSKWVLTKSKQKWFHSRSKASRNLRDAELVFFFPIVTELFYAPIANSGSSL